MSNSSSVPSMPDPKVKNFPPHTKLSFIAQMTPRVVTLLTTEKGLSQAEATARANMYVPQAFDDGIELYVVQNRRNTHRLLSAFAVAAFSMTAVAFSAVGQPVLGLEVGTLLGIGFTAHLNGHIHYDDGANKLQNGIGTEETCQYSTKALGDALAEKENVFVQESAPRRMPAEAKALMPSLKLD